MKQPNVQTETAIIGAGTARLAVRACLKSVNR